jgi:hypothetical protein
MDDLDSFTYRNASPGGQILDTYTDSERARVRAILLDYAADNGLSVEKLYKAFCRAERSTPETVGFSFKTFQRFLAGTVRVGDEVVAACARFAKGLPNRPTVFHALGEALHALYQTPLPPDLPASYDLVCDGDLSTAISINNRYDGFALVTERWKRVHRIHDGVLVPTSPGNYLFVLKDRNLRTSRQIMTSRSRAAIYEFCPVFNPGHFYSLYEGQLSHA